MQWFECEIVDLVSDMFLLQWASACGFNQTLVGNEVATVIHDETPVSTINTKYPIQNMLTSKTQPEMVKSQFSVRYLFGMTLN